MVDDFLKAGFTYFDTSHAYHKGKSQEATKKFLVQRHPRNGFTIAFNVNGKIYKTSRIIADLLSPIICKSHYNDESSNGFIINTKIDDSNDDYFSEFLQFLYFEENNIDSIHQKYYNQYFLQLGNINEYLQLQPEYFNNFTPENVIDQLKYLTENFAHSSFNNLNKIIEYAASHFAEIPKEKMNSIDIYFIEEIIKNKSFKIEDKDLLLHFILDMYEKDSKYSVLFEYVAFQNVSEHLLEKFINEFDIEFLNRSIWKSICERLLPSKKDQISNYRYMHHKNLLEFPYKEGNEMNRIIQYLSEQTSGNKEIIIKFSKFDYKISWQDH